MARVYIDKDPFWFVDELHTKMHDGYEPTQEDIDEVIRLMNIISDALKPVILDWVEWMVDVVRAVREVMEYLPEDVQEKFGMYGVPIIMPESGQPVQEPEPEKPMPHPHTTFGSNYMFTTIPAEWFYNINNYRFPVFDEEGSAPPTQDQSRLDRGTED